MKKIISVISCLVILLTIVFSMSGAVQAASTAPELPFENAVVVEQTRVELSDDYYVIITTYEDAVAPCSESYSKIGAKTATVYNKNTGNALTDFTVKGTFWIVDGASSYCSYVTYEHNIYNTAWYLDSAATSKSRNTASGTAVFKRKLLGIVVETEEVSVTVTCDVYGNIS